MRCGGGGRGWGGGGRGKGGEEAGYAYINKTRIYIHLERERAIKLAQLHAAQEAKKAMRRKS